MKTSTRDGAADEGCMGFVSHPTDEGRTGIQCHTQTTLA